MKNTKKDNPIKQLMHWAGKDKYYLYVSILCSFISGISIMVPYYGVYTLLKTTYEGSCTSEVLVENAIMISVAIVIRFVLFSASGALSHKGAYNSLYKVRCMVVEHMARVPLGELSERNTGDIKTVLNEDIEKLELFLAHHLPELVYYMCGPVVVFVYLAFINIPLAVISVVPLVLALLVMTIMFRGMDTMMDRVNKSISGLNSAIIEYINGMKLIKAYNMGSKSFKKYSDTIEEENKVWNEVSRKMGPPYTAYVLITECGMLLMVPIGGYWFLNGSITASVFLLFAFIGSLYLTELRPLQELGSNFAQVLKGINKTKEILDIPVYEGGVSFPSNYSVSLKNVRFSYDGKKGCIK